MNPKHLQTFDEICQNLWLDLENYIKYLEPQEKMMVCNAFQAAMEIYGNKKRDDGSYYLEHKVEVAKILAKIHLDQDTLAAALLYGSTDDKPFLELHRLNFPSKVFEIIEDLNKILALLQNTSQNSSEKYAENLRRMFVATGRDFRVFFIKLADRINNLKNMQHLAPEKAREIAEQAIKIDSEIASRMGISILKNGIEDSAFQYLHPKIWNFMVNNSVLNFENRTTHSKKLQIKTEKFLTERKFPYLEIMGRAKGYYAVYNKLYDKGKTIDEVHDLIALRIIVDDVPKCFQALDEIHTIFPEYVERTKNYIQNPKENGYQSIHTTVIDKETNTSFEFQIRTKEMHELAEYGAAAHWAYKKKVIAADSKLNFLDPNTLMNFGETLRRGAWNLLLKQKEAKKNLEMNLFQDKVFVLTPKGDVISLPDNSTALDFAYKIHQEVGNKAAYAKINSKANNLYTVLKTGDMVEIVTDTYQSPKKYWLNWSKTNTAHKMIKSYLKNGVS